MVYQIASTVVLDHYFLAQKIVVEVNSFIPTLLCMYVCVCAWLYVYV